MVVGPGHCQTCAQSVHGRCDCGFSPSAWEPHAAMRRQPGTALYRKRIECEPVVGTTQSVTVCEGCLSRVRRIWQQRSSEPGPDGYQSCSTASSSSPCGREYCSPTPTERKT